MSNLTKFKVSAAGLALVAAAGAAQAQSLHDTRRERAAEAATQPASTGGLTADDACRQLATTDAFHPYPAIGKAFARGADLGCSYTLNRTTGAFSVDAMKYNVSTTPGAATYDRAETTASARNDQQQRINMAQQERQDRLNSPMRQAQETMRDVQQGTNVLRQGQNLLRGFGLGR